MRRIRCKCAEVPAAFITNVHAAVSATSILAVFFEVVLQQELSTSVTLFVVLKTQPLQHCVLKRTDNWERKEAVEV